MKTTLTQDVQLNQMWKHQRYCQLYNEPCKPRLSYLDSSTWIVLLGFWIPWKLWITGDYSQYYHAICILTSFIFLKYVEESYWKHLWDYSTYMWKLSTGVNRWQDRHWGQHRNKQVDSQQLTADAGKDINRMKILHGQALNGLPSSKSHRKRQ